MKQFILILSFGLFIASAFSFIEKPLQEAWVAPEEAKSLKNTNASNKKSINNGESIYKTRCVICHGESGKGDGAGARMLKPKPADHTSESVQAQVDGEIFWKMSEGRGQMVGWGKGAKPIISESDRWDLVNYIRTLSGK